MAGKGRLHVFRVAQALLLALVLIQGVQAVNACMLPARGASMAFADAGMPDSCAGLSKNACLLAYLQADQVSGSERAAIGDFDDVAVPTALSIPGIAVPPRIATWPQTPPSTAPPPRILFCRLLR